MKILLGYWYFVKSQAGGFSQRVLKFGVASICAYGTEWESQHISKDTLL